jgi:RNA polymerase sigma-70 factor, ECF subfamily
MKNRINSNELRESMLPLHRFALVLTRNGDDANDLVQDSVERALCKQHLFEPGTNLRAWLFTICRRQFLNQVRKSKAAGVHIALEDAAQSALSTRPNQEQAMQLQYVVDGFHKLPPHEKVLLSLIALDGLTYEEAGVRLEIPVGTVRSRLSRARVRLRGLAGLETAVAGTA